MKRILVATDFSTRSDRALRRAVLLAGKHGASLSLVHVIDDDQPAYLVDRHQAAASELLTQTASTMREIDKIETDVLLTTGEPFTGILRSAHEIDADVIIVGPHRRQFLDTFIGTTAERTIRRTERPVLMVNAVPSGPYERTLLAVDFDDASRSAVKAAREFGIIDRTEVIALNLFDAPAAGLMKRASEPADAIDHYLDTAKGQATSEMQEFLRDAGVHSSKQVLKHIDGPVACGILASADDQQADLIVLGTNQRKGLVRFLLGSVTQRVLLDAERDVLVVPVEREEG